MIRVAILVDGAFYRKRAKILQGVKTPIERAKELETYCFKHLEDDKFETYLNRVFYYDCYPSRKNVYHPLTHKSNNLEETDDYKWAYEFFNELKKKRKFALRMGKLAEEQAYYNLKPEVTKKLFNNKISLKDIKVEDFKLSIPQKGVDMRIGIDIAHLSFCKQVDKIILISGDSDFVAASKQARREGIDFVLDPMWMPIKNDLFEHIDGLKSCFPNPNV